MLRDSQPAGVENRRRDGSRLSSLDGLRGIAALVVVLHHALLTWPVLAGQYAVPNPTSGTWWLTFTPLHLVWAGTEAVLVFFVLSGFVLTMTAGRTRRGPRWWSSYAASRALRLYIPVWASLLLATALVELFPRVPGVGTSWWFNAHAVTVDAGAVGADALLVNGVSWIHPSLWSLRYEVLFSLALPLYVLLVTRPRTPWWVPASFSLVLSGGALLWGSEVVSWLAVFGVGAAMASGRDTLRLVFIRWNARAGAGVRWTVFTGVAVVALLSEWWVRGAGLPLLDWMWLVRPLSVLGAGMLVAAALGWPVLGRVLTSAPAQWSGRISFSLYLVHEPIVVSVASVSGGTLAGVAVTATVGIGLAVLTAVLFHRFVEQPSHRLARAVGRSVGGARRDVVDGARRPLPTEHGHRTRRGAVDGSPVLTSAR